MNTDEWLGYSQISGDLRISQIPGNGGHNSKAIKPWIRTTYSWVSKKHRSRYLKGFSYRLNRSQYATAVSQQTHQANGCYRQAVPDFKEHIFSTNSFLLCSLYSYFFPPRLMTRLRLNTSKILLSDPDSISLSEKLVNKIF